MERLLLVGLGGGAGAVARYLAGLGYARAFGLGRSYVATFAVNVTGGLLMGLLVGWLAHKGADDQERWRLLLGVGVLGGFTTFSTFSLETLNLIERREVATALAYAAGSVVLSVAAVALGLQFARRAFA